MRAMLFVPVVVGLLLPAAHGFKEYDVSGTLTNCAVVEHGGGFEETCDLASDDEMLAGSWSFEYEIDRSGSYAIDEDRFSATHEFDPDEEELQIGEAEIVTNDGI